MDLSIKKPPPVQPVPQIKHEPIYDESYNYHPSISHATHFLLNQYYPLPHPVINTITPHLSLNTPLAHLSQNASVSQNSRVSPDTIVSSSHVVSPNIRVSPNPIESSNHLLNQNTRVTPTPIESSNHLENQNARASPNPTVSSNDLVNQNARESPNPSTQRNRSVSPHCEDTSKVSSSENLRDFNCNNLSGTTYLRHYSRPFKAIDPLSLALGGIGMSKESTEAYAEFRKKMLLQVQTHCNGTNKNMRRSMHTSAQNADPTYIEKRKRNNEAAKRSRDSRRAKEDEIAIRCAFLEQENIRLKMQLAAIEKQKKEMLLSLRSQH